MKKHTLLSYAELLAARGIHVAQGETVLIYAQPDQCDFVTMVTEACYRRGAVRVMVEWSSQVVTKLHYLYRSEKELAKLLPWEKAKWKWRSEALPDTLYLISEDPDGLTGIDQGKRARAQMAQFPLIKPYRDAMENRYKWCIAAVPGKAWAKKVFPKLTPARAEEALWQAILAASRALGDPLANWDKHNAEVAARCDKLNAFRFDRLEYRAPNGTDFTVGLLPDADFLGAAERDLSGRIFNPNIPSEEVFTTPARGRAEGIVYATKPLSYQGTLIEDFSVRFKGGKAVEVRAAKGQEVLEKMIAMDEGAAYLGECALIGFDSPINNTGVLFYETLFDENAACHLALGRGFSNCLRGYETLTVEECRERGINDSMIHVDFMIGCRDLEIDGVTKRGKRTAIFRRGDWCF